MYCTHKKCCPLLYYKSLYKSGLDFKDIQYISSISSLIYIKFTKIETQKTIFKHRKLFFYLYTIKAISIKSKKGSLFLHECAACSRLPNNKYHHYIKVTKMKRTWSVVHWFKATRFIKVDQTSWAFSIYSVYYHFTLFDYIKFTKIETQNK